MKAIFRTFSLLSILFIILGLNTLNAAFPPKGTANYYNQGALWFSYGGSMPRSPDGYVRLQWIKGADSTDSWYILSLYVGGYGSGAWESNEMSTLTDYATFQYDGNLVCYDVYGRPTWASHTSGKGGKYLALQNDGNMVIYRADGVAIWATHTNWR